MTNKQNLGKALLLFLFQLFLFVVCVWLFVVLFCFPILFIPPILNVFLSIILLDKSWVRISTVIYAWLFSVLLVICSSIYYIFFRQPSSLAGGMLLLVQHFFVFTLPFSVFLIYAGIKMAVQKKENHPFFKKRQGE